MTKNSTLNLSRLWFWVCLGLFLSLTVTARVRNLGIFQVLVNIHEKNMNSGILEPVGKVSLAVFVTKQL